MGPEGREWSSEFDVVTAVHRREIAGFPVREAGVDSPMSVGVSGPASDLVGDLDQELRAVVRRERVDPQLESARVRRLAEEVVRAHDERSLTGVVAPVPDPVGVVGELVARVSGFGPLQPFLDDPEVEEIWINDPSRRVVARNVDTS